MVGQSSPSSGLRIGYARVSTHEQSLDLQLDSLREAGCERIYSDKMGGTKEARPGLEQASEVLRAGDTLVVWRLDRLGRSLGDLIGWTAWLEAREVGLLSLQEQIDASRSSGKLVLHLFAALAQFERDLLRERTLAGLAAARARGRMGGRPPALGEAQIRQLKAMHRDKSISIGEICAAFGICRSSLYRYLKSA